MVKQAKNSFLVISILYILLGLVLLIWPGQFLKWGCYALGTVIVLYGASRIISYIANKNMISYFNADLIVGIVVVAVGLLLLIKPEIFISILPIVFGLFIIFNGIVKLQNAFDLKRLHYEKWWSIFVTAGLSLLLGLFIIWNPFETAALTAMAIGIVLIVEGIASAVTTIYSWRTIKQLSKIMEQAGDATVIIEEDEL